MAAKRGSYPHPVLDGSDDVASTFEVFNVSITPAVEDVQLTFEVRMTDLDIQDLIDVDRAKFNFRWKCSSTLSNGSLDTTNAVPRADSTRYTAWIDQRLIRRIVRVDLSIVATDEIADYRLRKQHPDYGDATFHVRPGDVLADAGSFEFAPDKLFDPLNPPIGSCFKFVADKKLRRGLTVRFDEDEQVVVSFPEERLAQFGGFGSRPDLQISLVVLPALMETIAFIKKNDEAQGDDDNLGERLWYQAVRKLVEEVGGLDDSPFELAQKVLAHPLDTVLSRPLNNAEED